MCWELHHRALSTRNSSEFEQRRGFDDLVQYAFEMRAEGRHVFRIERDLRLPKPPLVAKADLVTSIELPMDWWIFLRSFDTRDIFTSQKANPNLITTFVCEAKAKDPVGVARQIALDLCSAQHQRRALGFADGPIFGATLLRGTLQIYHSHR
ncbi:hypothetical protein BC834DRAFT_814716 [Gloeopeniophorella convolvens]|nr:hypothetical protein BC834DRAFT_814716 [Gloeopeniophorella convolvens]